jgi:hypothetical protein
MADPKKNDAHEQGVAEKLSDGVPESRLALDEQSLLGRFVDHSPCIPSGVSKDPFSARSGSDEQTLGSIDNIDSSRSPDRGESRLELLLGSISQCFQARVCGSEAPVNAPASFAKS